MGRVGSWHTELFGRRAGGEEVLERWGTAPEADGPLAGSATDTRLPAVGRVTRGVEEGRGPGVLCVAAAGAGQGVEWWEARRAA